MLLRCRATEPTLEQRSELGPGIRTDESFHLSIGEEYVALGLEFTNGIAWVDFAENNRTVISAPLFLFDIIDGQVSENWTVRRHADGTMRFWPDLFYERAFHDRLSNGEEPLVSRFVELRREMEAEAR